MKLLAVVACLSPLAAPAQLSPEEMMMQGLYRLNQAEKVTLVTEGSEKRGRDIVQVKVTVGLWHLPSDHSVRLEVMTFENGKLVSRQAGDGRSLWDFDVRSNSYSSVTYATDDGLPNDWKQRLFRTLRLRTSGPTAFTVRLLDDAFGTGVATGRWQPWIPVSTVARIDTNVSCEAKSPAPNTTLYTLQGSDDEGFALTGATYDQYDSTRSVLQKHWELSIVTGELPDNTDFGFVPPRGAKVVTIDQRSGG